MKLNKEELRKALEIVKPGLASKEMIEQSTSFAFTGGRVITYNDEISISHPVENLSIKGAINAEEMYNLLGKIQKDEIEIEEKESELAIKAGKVKASLAMEKEIKLLEHLAEIGGVGSWKKIPDNFTKFLKLAKGSCSADSSRPIFTCVNVRKDGKMEATDNYRLTVCALDKQLPVNTFLIPANEAQQVINFNPTYIAEGKGWVHFKTDDDSIISCRIFEDVFPHDTEKILGVEGEEVTFPESTTNIIERARIFTRDALEANYPIHVTIMKGKMVVNSESVKTGSKFEEKEKLKYDGSKIQFEIVPYLLQDILKETSTAVIGGNKMKFEGEGWEYVSLIKTIEE